jgi:hypothetical protein
MNLDPVAVELDLVKPALATRDLLDRRRQCRLYEARIERLRADGRRFLSLERHGLTPTARLTKTDTVDLKLRQ